MISNRRLAIAKRLARKGFYLFALASESKLPLSKGWQSQTTRDPEKLEEYFGDGANNIGIFTSKYQNTNLLVVDIDVKKVDGIANWNQIIADNGGCPDTFMQVTATGGMHLIFSTEEEIPNSAGKIGPGIDVRGKGGYIVGVGSKVPAGEYTVLSTVHDVQVAPDWLVALATQDREKKRTRSVSKAIDQDLAERHAKRYLQEASPAVQGEGGDNLTFKIVARVRDYGCEPQLALELMLEWWNDRCDPPWDPEDLKQKIYNAYQFAQNEAGTLQADNLFKPVPYFDNRKPPKAGSVGKTLVSLLDKKKTAEAKKTAEKAIDVAKKAVGSSTGKVRAADLMPWVRKMNEEYALVVAGGHHYIMQEEVRSDGKIASTQMAENTFHTYLASEKIIDNGGEKPKEVPLSRAWIGAPGRRTYKGIVFDPSGEAPKDKYNLWTGFMYRSQSEYDRSNSGLVAWKNHLLDNVCNGDYELAKWLTGYFAHMIQKPAKKPLVALVFQGEKGVGKNACVERVGELLGQHSLVTHDRRYLMSNFNTHLQNLLLLVLDEAYWSGDKKADGVLKGIITSGQHTIEPKGKESYSVNNYTRVILIGNDAWMVPASHDERRFAVFSVGIGRKQDTKFFNQMRVDMEQGGYDALMSYLASFDLTDIDVDIAPTTAGLVVQKMNSMPVEEAWWYEILDRGMLPGEVAHFKQGDRLFSTQAYDDFLAFSKKLGNRYNVANHVFYTKLASLRGGKKATPTTLKGRQGRAYTLGSLEEERNMFSHHYNDAITWS